jgi:hypothetical protein
MLLAGEHHGTEQEEEFGSADHPAEQASQTLTLAFQPRLFGELHCPKTISIKLSMFCVPQIITTNSTGPLKKRGFGMEGGVSEGNKQQRKGIEKTANTELLQQSCKAHYKCQFKKNTAVSVSTCIMFQTTHRLIPNIIE